MIPTGELGLLFSILHDGEICDYALSGDSLELRVRIPYLAQRLDPSYECFTVALSSASGFRFTTWPNDVNTEPQSLSELDDIFRPTLGILEGSVVDGDLQVICNQPGSEFGYSGGELRLSAAGAEVRDESGRHYDVSALQRIAEQYWDEWAKRGKA